MKVEEGKNPGGLSWEVSDRIGKRMLQEVKVTKNKGMGNTIWKPIIS